LDKVIFLIRDRKYKERVIYKKGEQFYPNCIQFQIHCRYTTPVYIFGTIGYSYKSLLLFVKSTDKNSTFIQENYLEQVLEKALVGILKAFGQIILPEGLQLQFIEDSNSAYSYKSTNNIYTK
jgi:hypothetical protein